MDINAILDRLDQARSAGLETVNKTARTLHNEQGNPYVWLNEHTHAKAAEIIANLDEGATPVRVSMTKFAPGVERAPRVEIVTAGETTGLFQVEADGSLSVLPSFERLDTLQARTVASRAFAQAGRGVDALEQALGLKVDGPDAGSPSQSL